MQVARVNDLPSWDRVFEETELERANIMKVLSKEVYFPAEENIYNALYKTPLYRVRVVIIGQDPYHDVLPDGTPQAQGLAFSVPKHAPIPPSLVNIFKEIQHCYPDYVMPPHGDLTSWTKQGVLLLNSCLTVRPHEPGSHSKYRGFWLPFITRVLAAITEVNPTCIYLLWGREAQKIRPYIGPRSIVFEAAHPSPLSASRGFFGCRHFLQVNEVLADDPIQW